MSCQFKAYAKFDAEDLWNLLSSGETSDGRGVRYNDSSGSFKDVVDNRELSFFSRCSVSFSPGGEFLVFAHKRSLCILSAKWDSHEEEDVKTKFKTIVTHNPCHNESEEITAAICLPLIMPTKSVRAAHTSEQTDWTCIVLGFNNGYVRFYDEGGDLLLSELVSDEPVQYIKCQSYNPSKTLIHDDNPEELYVTFQSTVAIIPGFALFQTLRACRNQLARVKANYAEHVAPPPLTLKRWAFIDQHRLRDCEVIGPSSSDMFDHLMTASIGGGFSARYRSGAPKSTLVVASGKGPFVGFHYALDGVEGRSVLTDVAQVVKSKFKGFFFGSSNDRQKNSGTMEAPENLACRFGLCDFNREGDHIVRSPNREYSAVTDALGRVTLVNNFRGIAIRMWKGYRKAQCGWLQVEEEEPSVKGNPKHLLRSVLFLVIYDPKKGMIEVWTVPNGIRVASFSCSKKGRLLYTSHGLVGLSSATGAWVNKSVLPCVFLDPEGTIFQINVPFHCALSDATSERAADLALLRKLKSTLRERHLEDEQLAQEVGLLACELKTAEVCKQMLFTLTSNRHVTVDALEGALAVFMDRASYLEKSCSENNWQTLFLSMQQLRNLIVFYKFVHQEREKPPNYSLVVPQEGVSDLQAMCDVLSVSDQELTALKSLMHFLDSSVSSHSTQKREPRVTFCEDTSSRPPLVDFLACFDFGKKSETSVAPNAVAIKKLPPAKLNLLADLLFQGILYNDVPVEMWQAEAACSGILPSNLLLLAVHFWLLRNAGKALGVEMIRFAEITKAICLLEEVNSCDLSSFWSLVRNSLAESTQPFNALTAALVCRAVACSLEKQGLKKHSKSPKKANKKSPTTNNPELLNETDISSDMNISGSSSIKTESRKSSNEWEDVSWDSVKWNMLIGRLEDIALLDQILSQNPADLCDSSTNSKLFSLNYMKPSLSLSNVLQKGKGAISEQVAKWLTSSGLDPKLLIDGSDIEWMEKNAGLANSPSSINVDEPQPEDQSEVAIREGIPLMTEKGTEASSIFTSHARILDKICLLRKNFPYSMCGSVLLANVSWEFLLEWHKNPEQINILNTANTCLQIIPNIHVREGVSSLIWSSHLKQRFETATRIINESKGNPKEKLCRKDLQMSESHLVDFAEACLKFLELFIEAASMSEVMHCPGPGAVVNRFEDIWDYDEEIAVANTPSLTGLALAQSHTSFEHLDLLHQLALTVHMVLSLGLRGQQLTPLFKPEEWSRFFSDSPFETSKIMLEPSEPHLSSKRTQFLMFAVSSAMQSVMSSDPVHINDLSGGVMSDMKTAMKWFGLCQHLAYTWQISVDPIRRHQVCLLYTTGHDRLAEEILTAVNEVDLLAKQLLLICGQRLKVIMDHSVDLEEKISNLDPFLSAYLFELRTNEVREVSITDTALLATHVVQHLPENDPEHPLAVSLFDALQALSTSDEVL